MSRIRARGFTALAALLLLVACATAPPTDTTAPGIPAGLAATIADTEVVLSWSANLETDLRRYNVYRGTTSGALDRIAAVPAGTESFTDTDVVNGDRYLYAIDAEDRAGNLSARSGEVEATPTAAICLFDDGAAPFDACLFGN